ncbi:hypothetical protein KFL_008240020 [Klebsormidium nitens]|uniref:Uncharacterized protein n=1 Tax=Klebsormidium nitens TaxID=105231 RepID=A0A1Y1IQW7_KLENI|nr:hypothetical protein KFL_008240020 [Klebsormidium nitens]|eukprot:GAQ91641.1 hypothetical protein KFL_008240020 [Klebsormidium nitens]
MEDDDYCIVEYAQLDADGMRLSKEDCALARKAKEVACQRDQILQLLGEIKDSVGSFDEARLLYRNWRVRVLKSLRRQRIFDELPEFSGVCGSCRQDVGYYSVHAIVKSGSVEWICHSCDVMDNQDLADLRAAVDANLLKLRTSLNELAEVASLQQVQKLIRIRDVLKASAKAPGERYEVPRIGGHEFFEWKLLVIDPMPNFPKEELERREFCAMMSTKERADLTRLMKQVERLHQRYFHTDLLGLIADSVKTRNMHMQKRFETIRKPALFESLSPEAAKALWDAQKGKCSSCGDDMLWSRLFGGGWLCPELDRTDVHMAQSIAFGRVAMPVQAFREREERSYRVKRGQLPARVHVLEFGQAVLCNPTGMRDNKLCAVAFPSKPLLQSVNAVLENQFRIGDMSTDALLTHIETLQDVEGVFEVNDCFCQLENRKTYYMVTQILNEGDEAFISERVLEFDN